MPQRHSRHSQIGISKNKGTSTSGEVKPKFNEFEYIIIQIRSTIADREIGIKINEPFIVQNINVNIFLSLLANFFIRQFSMFLVQLIGKSNWQ